MDRLKQLIALVGDTQVLKDEPMKNHTTFRVGGPADYFVCPRGVRELQEVLAYAKNERLPYFVMGNGSNLLCLDGGFRGIVIQIGTAMSEIEWDSDCVVRAGAGVMLSKLAAESARHGMSGLEFAGGIPGSLGGAVAMNAGAYGGEISQCLVCTRVLKPDGELVVMSLDEMAYAYRNSILLQEGGIAVEATFQLIPGEEAVIRERMMELNQARRDKQPLEYPSAGSTFKRPEGYFAGKLIQDAGLRGAMAGGAQVSEKHCGFVINRDQATAADIMTLIKKVQSEVKRTAGVDLETEVRVIGEPI